MSPVKFAFIFLALITVFNSCKTEGKNEGITHRKPANEIEENIYRSGDSMMAAFKRKDWNAYVQYNHPSMMQMMGGSENFVSFIKEQMKQIPDTAIKKIGLGDILQVIKTEKDYQCVVEQSMHMQLEGISINTTTYLIGESLDQGKTWTFFDASSSGLVTPKDIKPNISPDLKIPVQKKEVKQLE